MILIGLAFTALGIAIASKMEDMHGFHLIMNFMVFPLFGLSGAIFPLDSLPAVLKTLAMIDPLTYGVDGIRYGLLGSSSINPVFSFVMLGGFTLIMVVVGALLFRNIKL